VTERIPKIVYVAPSLAFVFMDVAPSPVSRGAFAQSFRTVQQDMGEVAPGQ